MNKSSNRISTSSVCGGPISRIEESSNCSRKNYVDFGNSTNYSDGIDGNSGINCGSPVGKGIDGHSGINCISSLTKKTIIVNAGTPCECTKSNSSSGISGVSADDLLNDTSYSRRKENKRYLKKIVKKCLKKILSKSKYNSLFNKNGIITQNTTEAENSDCRYVISQDGGEI